jgi:uncharacterized protein DUF3306
MSDPENFIARWSRRKLAAERVDDERAPDEKMSDEKMSEEARRHADDTRPEAGSSAPARNDAPSPEPPVDLAKLPPLESISADSDIRAFLAPGVPVELTRAALRRAWSTDPKIRDFVGLADYDWDFNTPGAIAGFGPLEMTDELRRQVAQMVGRSLAPEAPGSPDQPSGKQASVEASDNSTESHATTLAAPVGQAPSNVGSSQDKSQVQDVESNNLVQRKDNPTSQNGTETLD